MTYQKLTRDQMAMIAAQDIEEGSCVNLGIGLPTRIADFVPKDRELFLHSEQGLLGLGPRAADGEEDPDVVNAGKQFVTLLPGASVFSHSDSFLMIRGGHIDIACLGAFQVSQKGDLANWSTGIPDQIPAVGGAMDLAAGAVKVWVLMEHCTKNGRPRLMSKCTYPLTAPRCVNRIYTDLAVLEIEQEVMKVRRMVAGMTFSQLQNLTDAPLILDPNCLVYGLATGSEMY